ncbi:MAG: DUF4175 family protein [bacterium]
MSPASGRPGRELRARLAGFLRRRLANDLAALLLLLLGLLTAGVAVAALAFWSGWTLVLLAVPFGFACRRWLAGLRRRALGYAVEAEFPALAGRLVAALDLADGGETREAYSAELRAAAVRAVEEQARELDFGRACRRGRVMRAGFVAVVGAGLLLGARLTFPARFGVGVANAFAPGRLSVRLGVAPGDTAVMPGTELELVCRVEPPGVFRAVSFEQPGRRARRVPLAGDTARVRLYAAREQRYRFRVLGTASAEHRVRVLEPLSIEELGFTCRYPPHTGLPDTRSAGPDLSAPVGSEFAVVGRASQELAAGRLSFAAETVALEPGPGGRFAGRFRVRADGRGVFELLGDSGGAFQVCGHVTLRAVPDESPLVRILRPGRDVELPMTMRLPLAINSLDDYGLGTLWLRWGRESLDTRVRVKGLAGRREDTTLHVWDLSGFGILPGDAVRYRAEVTDNDAVSGPKTGRSEVFEVRFPTMAEIYNASVRQAEVTRSELAPLSELQERLTEEVGRLGEQARGAGELSWEERQALGDLLAEQQDLAAEISDLREQVRRTMDDIYDGVAYDEETMRRLGELERLLSELLPRELAESLERLREKLGESGPELRAALGQFEFDQEQLRRGLDDALEFLRQVMEEQQLEALARTAEELARVEDDIARRAPGEPADKLGREQEALSDALDSLLAGIEELAGEMSDSAAAGALAELAGQAEQDRLSAEARASAAQFRQGRPGPAQEQASEVARKLGELGTSLGDLGGDLKRRRSEDLAGRLGAAVEELLMLSRTQEELERQIAETRETGPAIGRQMGLHDATGVIAESLAALPNRTLSVSGRLVGELGRAREAMKSAGQDLLEARAAAAGRRMAEARASLDRVAAGLLEAMASAERGGGMSGGFEGLMEALSRLAAGQMSVNIGTGGLPIPMPGGMSPGLAEALGRLLAQQGALRERLEHMLDQLGGERPGLTSALDGLVEEMRQVERDFAEMSIQRELIARQEGILSRLLDAQRSVRQQGRKEERESETAGAFERDPVPGLPEDRGERNRLLREELMRSLREGRLGRFEPQVRRYFEHLLEEQ